MTLNSSAPLAQIHKQVMWNRLISVVEEQAQTLIRTAFGTPVREAGDLSAGVYDLNGRMLAQAVTGTPGHVNAMAASVGHFIRKYPVETMREGDVFVTNDPWLGTGHLNDFTVVSPTFRQGKLVALFASTAHVVDVGGLGFGPDGRQVYEEGIYVPMMYFARAGQVNEDLLEIVRWNVREPIQVEGDLYSLEACNRTGSERLVAMMDEFGMETIDELADWIIDTSHQAMLDEIGKLRAGTYHNSMRIDGYEREVDLVATMTIGADGIDVDFTGTSSVSSYGINLPLTYTQAYASFGVRCVVGATVPNNAGSLSAVRVSAPEGCILNAPHPCAVTARHVIGQMLPDVVLGCLHEVIPGGTLAEGTSCLWNPVLLGGHGVGGTDAPGAKRSVSFAVNCFHAGGMGARPSMDGLNATAFPSGVRNTPVEVTETIAPLICWQKEFRPDSGGPGTFRGGAGQIMSFSHADDAPFAISAMFDRVKHAPRGRSNGQDGQTGQLHLASGKQLPGMGRHPVPPGDRIVMEMPGGAGFGDPLARDPAMVAADVLAGFVSVEAARCQYGVVLDAGGGIDEAATAAERESHRAA
ncbi:N-methylhydantoinase B [Constrictibacter sp. MBR-5]|jgi:N-methylhydantoinase B|uniref:hydantoinase B/oxoprolinase family protein n=1 Tax=Constrictibacter sp. MBR-5 TaxID=3156467 RepID=UPI00339B1D3A